MDPIIIESTEKVYVPVVVENTVAEEDQTILDGGEE